MRTEGNLIRAAFSGLGWGILLSATVIAGYFAVNSFKANQFQNWINSSKNKINIASNYCGQVAPIYVPMFQEEKNSRKIALYTDSLGTCCALMIDNKKEDTHYLSHFTAVDRNKEIEGAIKTNFKDLSELEFIIVGGLFQESIATRSVYETLKKLDVLDKTGYIKSDKILMHEGKFYYPSDNH